MPKPEDQFRELFEASTGDFTGCAELLDSNPESQVLRRAFVRAALAAVEAVVYMMKQEALESHNRKVRFSTAEVSLLKEEAFSLSNGKARVGKAKLRLIDNLKFAFKSMADSGFSNYSLDLNSKGWNQFHAAVNVRDRLMHPKQASDLIVADVEVENTKAALLWFLETVKELVESLTVSMKETNELLREAISFANGWLKSIAADHAEDSWKSLSSAYTGAQTLDEWKKEIDRNKGEFGSAVVRSLVFKTRITSEAEAVFRLVSYAFYRVGSEARIMTEDLTVAHEPGRSWKVRVFELAPLCAGQD